MKKYNAKKYNIETYGDIEGPYWHWRIVPPDGVARVDGGNYLSEAQARTGMLAALDALIRTGTDSLNR